MWHVSRISFVDDGGTRNRKAGHRCIDESDTPMSRLAMSGRCSSDSLPQRRLLPGKPALTYTFANECAPGQQVTGKPPGAHPAGRKWRDQIGSKTALPERLGPLLRPLRMFRVPVQEQHAQRVEVSQEALPVGAGLVPLAQDVAWDPHCRLSLPGWGRRDEPQVPFLPLFRFPLPRTLPPQVA